MLKKKIIILGVTGCIAAYKSATMVSRLKDLGAEIWVIMTREAAELVGPLTFRTLSGNPVTVDLFSQEIINAPVPHISLADRADLIVIAPCTANVIGKIAGGIADDALTTVVMASTAKKLIAPAMNPRMWRNPVVQENIGKLKSQGGEFIGPAEGKLACGEEEVGRMVEPEEIVEKIIDLLVPKQDLKGKRVLVTAGGTREAIDPVRYISNRSSGRMGYALAQAARERGASVTLISANVDLPSPLDIKPIKVESADEMLSAVEKNLGKADVVIMAAAVADFKPVKMVKSKIKKVESRESRVERLRRDLDELGRVAQSSRRKLELEETPDILRIITRDRRRPNQKIVGFALETDAMIGNARKKLKDKDLDLIVANGPENFGGDTATVTLIDASAKTKKLRQLPKKEIARRILDAVLRL
jgi:phosphopantothenoylcysteine decarboxylase/phosphopantothenate--cysteine ligase